MSGELELAGWTIGGEKLWSTFAEPPWSYQVDGGRVHLDVMGKYTAFDIHTGPAARVRRPHPYLPPTARAGAAGELRS